MKVRITGNSEYGNHIKALICGDAGQGKTLISSTFANPVYASAESGLMSIADRSVPYVDIKNSSELQQMKAALDQSPATLEKIFGTQIETVVIDTIDEIQRMLVRERLESEKKDKLSLPDFGWLSGQLEGIIRGFRNLPMNVVFTCHLKETRDDDLGRIVYKPQLQGSIADQISGMVDLALLLTTRTVNEIVDGSNRRTIKRFIQTFPDAQHPWVKDRSGKLPQEFPVNFVDDFDRMHKIIYGGK